MDKVTVKFKVYFEEPFWIGVIERIENQKLSVCKITFGPEPKEYDIQKYILNNWHTLKFSPAIETFNMSSDKINPKRLQRKVKKEILDLGIGTKSQQALKLQQEEKKLHRKAKTRKEKEAESKRIFAMKQEKRKAKHKGR
ncbi:YjdF family protein [Anaerosacchariphilus polymeriproducens]|uniref:DUF2992 family protein n=1 Tax=Anaerosacchariphilus polymeriproducens TaxID=1812858 RepID=A0A371ATP5_9FIRM|nr:YjdF family protein [Anaerosacchariphilus polymeriproducens]RDU22912.1 DUF2992 family protein [Anaerosacchariphilus polymeriproducens]